MTTAAPVQGTRWRGGVSRAARRGRNPGSSPECERRASPCDRNRRHRLTRGAACLRHGLLSKVKLGAVSVAPFFPREFQNHAGPSSPGAGGGRPCSLDALLARGVRQSRYQPRHDVPQGLHAHVPAHRVASHHLPGSGNMMGRPSVTHITSPLFATLRASRQALSRRVSEVTDQPLHVRHAQHGASQWNRGYLREAQF